VRAEVLYQMRDHFRDGEEDAGQESVEVLHGGGPIRRQRVKGSVCVLSRNERAPRPA
jgi:hypothetical protein